MQAYRVPVPGHPGKYSNNWKCGDEWRVTIAQRRVDIRGIHRAEGCKHCWQLCQRIVDWSWRESSAKEGTGGQLHASFCPDVAIQSVPKRPELLKLPIVNSREFCCRWPDAGQKIAGECNVFRILKKKIEITNLKCDLFVSKRRSKDLLDKILFFITLNYFWM